MAMLTVIIAVVYLISWCVLYAGEQIITRFGEGKVRIITRVLGIVLRLSPCNTSLTVSRATTIP